MLFITMQLSFSRGVYDSVLPGHQGRKRIHKRVFSMTWYLNLDAVQVCSLAAESSGSEFDSRCRLNICSSNINGKICYRQFIRINVYIIIRFYVLSIKSRAIDFVHVLPCNVFGGEPCWYRTVCSIVISYYRAL